MIVRSTVALGLGASALSLYVIWPEDWLLAVASTALAVGWFWLARQALSPGAP